MQRVFLVACSREKAARPAPAKLLYQSRRFRSARRAAEQLGGTWFILSGKYGLLTPETIISPYDLRLGDQSADFQRTWATQVVAELAVQVPHSAQIIVLGAEEYSRHLSPLLISRGYVVVEPFRFRTPTAQLAWMDEICNSSEWSSNAARLYALLDRLSTSLGGRPRLRDCRGGSSWPQRGLYFFFDPDEPRWASGGARIVRVGTHGVSRGSKATLWNRLRTHRGGEDASGNHRSSIFRLHVGAAMNARFKDPSFPNSWGVGQAAGKEIRHHEEQLERQVSKYIGNLQILWLAILDEASPDSDRAYLEQNCVALLSGARGPLDPPTSSWLGNWSPRSSIRSSGLWNVDYVDRAYDDQFLDVFDAYVRGAEGIGPIPADSLAPQNWRATRVDRGAADQLGLFKGV